MSIRLYIGNLPRELERQEFEAVFAEDTESIVSVKLIADRKTGKCRGFGFVTVKTDELADTLVEKYNGYLLKETELKVEKALPRTKEGSDLAPPEPVLQGSHNGGGGNNVGNNAGNNRRNNNKKNRKATTSSVTTNESDSGTIQPDPRWASELEKLKEMLAAAQTTAS